MGHALKKLSLVEFLAWDDAQPERYEFVNGEVFCTVGGTLNHARVVRELTSRLHAHLKGSPCEVFSESTKILAEGAVFYPDVFVTCERKQPGGSTVADAPVLIIEVISPSTRSMDYDTKLALYRRLASLQQYVLIDPTLSVVESYTRQSDEAWVLVDHTPSGELPLPGIDLRIPIADLFATMA